MEFESQSAKSYRPTKEYGVSGWWSSPKIKGIRCLYLPGKGLFSRTLKTQFVGFENIEQVCQSTGLNIIDGVLSIPGVDYWEIFRTVFDSIDYNPVEKAKVQFHVFAILSVISAGASTERMVNSIPQIIPNNQSFVVPVPQIFVPNTPADIQKASENFRILGYSDGKLFLRNPDVAYFQGRSDYLLKVRSFEKRVFTVVGFEKGRGQYSTTLGKLLVEGEVDGVQVWGKVGSGFSDTERQKIWENQTKYLNQPVEIIYLGVTSKFVLRHPVFSRFV